MAAKAIKRSLLGYLRAKWSVWCNKRLVNIFSKYIGGKVNPTN